MKTEKKAHVWARQQHEWYVENTFATAALLTEETFDGGCWDPCCGGGNIVRTLRAAGLSAIGTDLIRRVPAGTEWFGGRFNFLERLWSQAPAPNVIMNPPYFRALGTELFIRKALVIPGVEKVAAFVSIRFLAGEGRARGLFADYPPSRIWSISPRPSCPPGEVIAAGEKPEGGTDDYVWLVWDLGTEGGQPRFGWVHPEGPIRSRACG